MTCHRCFTAPKILIKVRALRWHLHFWQLLTNFYLFLKQLLFQDISKWDTSKVTTTHRMFETASLFNSDLSKWDMSNVRYMNVMFRQAYMFNQDISKWVTAKVTSFEAMFQEAQAFNADISKWVGIGFLLIIIVLTVFFIIFH